MSASNKVAFAVTLALVLLLSTLPGCGGKQPFLLVQTCLRDQSGVAQFKSTVKSIALSHGMNYIDGSEETQRKLVALKANRNYQIIDIAVERGDGLGLVAGNLGLSAYEVAVGFSRGSDAAEAHKFADEVVGTLKKRWQIYVVPPGRGALPMEACEK